MARERLHHASSSASYVCRLELAYESPHRRTCQFFMAELTDEVRGRRRGLFPAGALH